jgi:hypothetical protein
MTDPNRDVLMTPRPWPRIDLSTWLVISWIVQVALIVVGFAWLVTK